jgi:hypothetical protein
MNKINTAVFAGVNGGDAGSKRNKFEVPLAKNNNTGASGTNTQNKSEQERYPVGVM